MWALRNKTPYAAERNWIRDTQGVHWWIVAVRATFTLNAAGELSLDDEQPPPSLEPEYTGDPNCSSLRRDSDLLGRVPGTDILVLGKAYAPHGRPASHVPVMFRMGALEKQIVVYGNRVYYQGAMGRTMTSPQRFVEQPIDYTLAYGGALRSDPDPARHRIDERNPIGRGFPDDARIWINQPAHCIEYPSGSVSSRGPAGLGPIDRAWLPRRALAGTFDARWAAAKRPLLPDDYDLRFAHCAPPDQRTPTPLSGGERIGVLNMNPEGVFVVEVPRVSLQLTSHFGRRHQDHGAQLTNVTIEPNDRRVSIVWQSSLRVPAPAVDVLDLTQIVERRGAA